MQATPLIRAAQRGNIIEVRHLLAAGADPNEGAPPHFTALNAAAAHGHRPIVELLLVAGAKPDYYALNAAAGANHAKIVRLLLAAGAPVTHPGEYTPLLNQLRYYGFTREQQAQVRQLLQDAGARELPQWHLRWRWALRYGWRWRLRRWLQVRGWYVPRILTRGRWPEPP